MENKRPQHSVYQCRLVGNVNYEKADTLVKEIDAANWDKEAESVRVTLASSGGELYCGFALYDFIRASEKPVDIVATGVCMSVAVLVLQAARRRISRKHTTFMVHPSNNSTTDKSYAEFLAVAEQYKRNHDLYVRLSIGRSAIDREAFEKMYEPRKYMDAEEALKLGFIDAIE